MSGEQILFLAWFVFFLACVGACGLGMWIRNRINKKIKQRKMLEMVITNQQRIIEGQKRLLHFYELEVQTDGLR